MPSHNWVYFKFINRPDNNEGLNTFCSQTQLHPESLLNCANHYSGFSDQKSRAESLYLQILDKDVAKDLLNLEVEASIGLSQLTNNLTYIDQFLGDEMQDTKIDSTLRLYLLTEKLRLDTTLSQAEKEELQNERLLLGRSNPTLVAQTAMETTTQFE